MIDGLFASPRFRAGLCKSEIVNLQSEIRIGGKGIAKALLWLWRVSFALNPRRVTRPASRTVGSHLRLQVRRFGGKGIRTPDIQLAKLALYQLSYAPAKNCRL